MKKIFGVITAIICALCTISIQSPISDINVSAATYSDELSYGDYLKYKKVDEDDDGTYDYVRITDCDESATEIEIPGEIDGVSVTYINNNAFLDCTNLSDIEVAAENKNYISIDGVLFDKDKTELIKYPNGNSRTEYSIPNCVISIGENAFYHCANLTNINIPDSVTSIGDVAFSGCTNLTSINIPDGMTIIGIGAFSGCTNLTSINIPDGVRSIESDAFSGCTNLTSINIPDSVTSIGGYAFHGTKLLKNQTGVKYIDKWVVGCDEDVTTVEIKDGTRGIGSSAFCWCESLTNINIPDSVTSIGGSAFFGTKLLKNQTGVKYADTWVIDCDEDVTTSEIKDGTRGIGDGSFWWCENLTNINIPDSVTSIGRNVFFNCKDLFNIEVAAENENYSSIDGVLFNKDKTELIQYPIGNSRVEYNIPDSVTSIGSYAFYDCTRLTNIKIPNSVTNIGESAFESCVFLGSIIIRNPNCVIYDDKETISNRYDSEKGRYFTGTIYGYENSTAQAYAEKYSYEFKIIGDLNGDGTVSSADVVLMNEFLTNSEASQDILTSVADMNGDGVINVFDLIILKRSLLS